MTTLTPSPGIDPAYPDHPIEEVQLLLARLRSCADIIECVVDSTKMEPRLVSQFYNVAEMVRHFAKEADKQAFAVCAILNKLEGKTK